MRIRLISLVVVGALHAAAPLLPAPAAPPQAEAQYWPSWRGPDATGVAPAADPPAAWSETSNVRWQVVVPGRGSGSPVVWGDKVFVLTAVSESGQPAAGVPHRFVVMAFDRRNGEVVWERVAREEAPHEATHRQSGTYASASPVTDGEVFAARSNLGDAPHRRGQRTRAGRRAGDGARP